MPPFPVPPFPIPFPTHLRFRPAFPYFTPVLPPMLSRLPPSRSRFASDFSPAFSQSPYLAPAPPISFPCLPPLLLSHIFRRSPSPLPADPSPRSTRTPPRNPFPNRDQLPLFPRAHKRAHKKRTAGIAPAALSIYRRTAAPSLRAGITPRPSLPWQPSWRSSPRQPPWRSSERPDLRYRPASSSQPKR